MKLFAFAALVAVASAGRLEHLERSYLPPDNNQNGNGFGSANGHFGAGRHNSNGLSISGHSSDGFGSQQDSVVINSNDHSASQGSRGFVSSSNGFSRNAAFGSATSNQYLPPNHGPSRSSNYGVHQFGARSGSSSQGSNGFGSHSGSHAFSSQPQFGAASRQYLAPKYKSSQQSQQPFDVNSGYIY